MATYCISASPIEEEALLYFEDFVVGTRQVYGSVSVSAADIIAFAEEYDAQPMHVDPQAAEQSMFGGLVASGWHSCCLMTRLMCDGFLLGSAALGAPGIQDVKFLQPVRPGDILRLETVVRDGRISQSRPRIGLVGLHFELINQRGACVLTMDNVMMIRRRPQGEVG